MKEKHAMFLNRLLTYDRVKELLGLRLLMFHSAIMQSDLN